MSQPPRTDSWSVTFGLGLGLAVTGIAIAATSRGSIMDLNPGLLGSFTAGLVGILLAGLHGVRFTTIVLAIAPILACEALAGVSAAPALLGDQVAALGILGLVLATRIPRAVASKRDTARSHAMAAASATNLR